MSTSRFAIALSIPALALAGLTATSAVRPSAPVTAAAASPAVSARLLSVASTSRRRVDRRDHDGDRDVRRDWMTRNQEIAWQMMPKFGWKSRRQFRFLKWLWNRESGWNVHALNPYSGAYGIPQAVPGGKMASAGRHWRTSARVQIRWGLRYIKAVYHSPKRAWAHEVAYGWY